MNGMKSNLQTRKDLRENSVMYAVPETKQYFLGNKMNVNVAQAGFKHIPVQYKRDAARNIVERAKSLGMNYLSWFTKHGNMRDFIDVLDEDDQELVKDLNSGSIGDKLKESGEMIKNNILKHPIRYQEEMIYGESVIINTNPEKIIDFPFDTVYMGSPNYFDDGIVKSSKEFWVTPYKGLASIFAGDHSPRALQVPRGSFNEGYDEWELPLDECKEPFDEIHIRIEGMPEVKEHVVQHEGYIYTIDVSKYKDHLYRYPWMNKKREVCILGLDKIEFDKREFRSIKAYVRGTELPDELKEIYRNKDIVQEGSFEDIRNGVNPHSKNQKYNDENNKEGRDKKDMKVITESSEITEKIDINTRMSISQKNTLVKSISKQAIEKIRDVKNKNNTVEESKIDKFEKDLNVTFDPEIKDFLSDVFKYLHNFWIKNNYEYFSDSYFFDSYDLNGSFTLIDGMTRDENKMEPLSVSLVKKARRSIPDSKEYDKADMIPFAHFLWSFKSFSNKYVFINIKTKDVWMWFDIFSKGKERKFNRLCKLKDFGKAVHKLLHEDNQQILIGNDYDRSTVLVGFTDIDGIFFDTTVLENENGYVYINAFLHYIMTYTSYEYDEGLTWSICEIYGERIFNAVSSKLDHSKYSKIEKYKNTDNKHYWIEACQEAFNARFHLFYPYINKDVFMVVMETRADDASSRGDIDRRFAFLFDFKDTMVGMFFTAEDDFSKMFKKLYGMLNENVNESYTYGRMSDFVSLYMEDGEDDYQQTTDDENYNYNQEENIPDDSGYNDENMDYDDNDSYDDFDYDNDEYDEMNDYEPMFPDDGTYGDKPTSTSISIHQTYGPDDPLSNFGNDNDGKSSNNEYDEQEVKILNDMIADENQAVMSYFNAAKNTNVDVLRRLYSDIGSEEGFHVEQLMFAKAQLVGEEYHPQNEEVKKEYEELLKMGMDEETAMTTAVDKLGIYRDDSNNTEKDMEELQTDVQQLEESFNYASAYFDLIMYITESPKYMKDDTINQYFMEMDVNMRVGGPVGSPTKPFAIIAQQIRNIYNIIHSVLRTATTFIRKRQYKLRSKFQWLRDHGIMALFENGIDMYFYNDKTSKIEIGEALRYMDILYKIMIATGNKCGIKVRPPKKDISMLVSIRGFDNSPMRTFANIDDGLNIIDGIMFTKSRVVVNETNESSIIDQFFGYTDQIIRKPAVKKKLKSGIIDQPVKSENAYNILTELVECADSYLESATLFMEDMRSLEADMRSVFYTNRADIYSPCLRAAKKVVKGFQRVVKCATADLNTMMKLDQTLNNLTSAADQRRTDDANIVMNTNYLSPVMKGRDRRIDVMNALNYKTNPHVDPPKDFNGNVRYSHA